MEADRRYQHQRPVPDGQGLHAAFPGPGLRADTTNILFIVGGAFAGLERWDEAKAALESETASWAWDLANSGKNVTCNSLSPGGATLTGMIYEDYGDRKLVDPDVMGPPIVFLASDLSNGVNGRFGARRAARHRPRLRRPRRSGGHPALTRPGNAEPKSFQGEHPWPITAC